MGLRAALRLTEAVQVSTLPPPRVQAPWADTSTLATLVWSDLLGAENVPIDRAAAMMIPAMSRARHLLAGSIAGCPLIGVQAGQKVTAPLWATRTDQAQSPWARMIWTVDDLIFTGHSLWYTPRNSDGHVLTAERRDRNEWRFGDDARTVIDAATRQPVKASDHTLISGPHEGVLTFGATTLRTAARLERTTARHAAQPVPAIDLHQTEDVEITDTERKALVKEWITARQSEYGSVAFTSYGIEARALGEVPEALLIDGRNSQAVDVARHVSIPAALIDATAPNSTLRYETTEGRNEQYLDYGASLYMDAITARLSQDDVSPRGTGVVFETSQLTATSRGATDPEPTNAPTPPEVGNE